MYLYCPDPDCGKKFRALRFLRAHWRKKHFDGRCIACDYVTSDLGALTAHSYLMSLGLLEGKPSETAVRHAIQYVLLKREKNKAYELLLNVAVRHLRIPSTKNCDLNVVSRNPALYRKINITVLVPKLYLDAITKLMCEGKYSTRTSFIITAIKNQLEKEGILPTTHT